MDQHANVQVTESSFPMGLVVAPMLVGALVWMCVIVSRVAF